ncbi:MAG: Fe-S cluster assembly protein NifU [Desulfobacter sp.]|nr:MAG: Fe-S cluster assembly protein NifU [Desulfobacter sp.]
MWDYTDKVKEHFLNPKNVGELEGANAVGETGSLSCGDALKLFLKVNENERIIDASFMTFGCASAVASSSALTEIIKGMTLDEAAKVTNDDIADFLGGLPKEKMHCSVMGQAALKKAIADYRGIQILEKPGEMVCECFDVTDLEIIEAVKTNGLETVEDVTNYLKAGGGCGKCLDRIEEIVVETRNETAEKINN